METLFKEHFSYLFDYGMKLTKQEELVKDCIQDMFTYLWEKRQRLAKAHSVKAYLIVSLRRNLLKALKKQNKGEMFLQALFVKQSPDNTAFEELLIYEEKAIEDKEMFKSAFKQIPDRMREALYLKTYQEHTYKEIASIMGVRPQVARNYVSEAFKRLREILG